MPVRAAPSFDPLAPFLDAVPVDRHTVMSDALKFARQERQMQIKLFGAGAKSIFESVMEGMAYAVQREDVRRHNKANAAYTASLHPLERERRALELEMTLLRDKMLGITWPDHRRFVQEKMRVYSARLAEIDALQSKREAA